MFVVKPEADRQGFDQDGLEAERDDGARRALLDEVRGHRAFLAGRFERIGRAGAEVQRQVLRRALVSHRRAQVLQRRAQRQSARLRNPVQRAEIESGARADDAGDRLADVLDLPAQAQRVAESAAVAAAEGQIIEARIAQAGAAGVRVRGVRDVPRVEEVEVRAPAAGRRIRAVLLIDARDVRVVRR